jgi:CHAT domain-containing protein
LEQALASARRVYFAPDGVLNTIPIGLMADDNGRLVMERYDLRIVNSTKDLLRTPRLAQAKSALLVGNPKFDLVSASQRTALAQLNDGSHSGGAGQQQVTVPGSQRGGELTGPALNPLPGTQVEVNAIEKLLTSSGWKADAYTGEMALKAAVTGAHGPRVVHVATHGFFLSDQDLAAKTQGQQPVTGQDPMLRSGLFFAGADRVRAGTPQVAGLDDGVLTAYESSQLNLEGTELVVLSACETGLGAQSNSEGVFGLRRGLQEAGASAVMMSMWSVPDTETQELMALFYKHWLGGMEKPDALRTAQLEERETVRRRYGKDLPYYWGAFVMVSP